MTNSPYQDFKSWLCDGDPYSELNPDVIKAVYIVSALVMFAGIKEVSSYLNELYNNEDIYVKQLQSKKLEFFKELKAIATKYNLSPWDLSYINLKKEKFEHKDIQLLYPNLKTYEIDLLIEILKKDKNKAVLDVLTKKEGTKRKLSKADIKAFNKGKK